MVKIQKIALTKLLKLELPQFVKQVTECIEKHNPKALKLQDAYEILVDQRNKMALLKVPYGPHILTGEIHKLHLKRLKYSAAITSQMNFIRKMDHEDTNELVQLAHPIVELHLYYLRQNNQFVIDQTVSIFFDQLSKNSDILNAFQALGFKLYLDELKKSNDEHYKLSNERSKQISQRPKIDTVAVQKEAHYVLRALFEQINFFQFTYKEIDYSALIAEINGLITRFSGLIHIRATCNKTYKSKAKDKTEEAELKTLAIETPSQTKSLIDNDEITTPTCEVNKKAVSPNLNKLGIKGELFQNLKHISKLPDVGSS